MPHERHEELVIRGYVVAVALRNLAHGQTGEWWTIAANSLRALVCDVLLPAWLLDRTVQELDAHRGSPVCRVLTTAAASWAHCLAELDEEKQASLVMEPLELLGSQWSKHWCGLAPELQDSQSRLWFVGV